LVKGDIALPSYLRREVGPGGCIWDPILGKWSLRAVGQRW